MNKELLERVIASFSYHDLNRFFRVNDNYAEDMELWPQYNDDKFTDFQKLGELRFDTGEKLITTTSFVNKDLSERSGKKDQYEKAKKILKEQEIYDAGFFVFHDESGNFRFSLVYGQAEGTKRAYSNFRRFTYFVSRDQTNKTFLDRVGDCAFSSLDVIKDAFSVEKVNKEFYKEIASFFYRLTGYKCIKEMTLPSVNADDKQTYQEFAVRLIGRIVFCWFLKHKKSRNGIPLMSKEALSVSAVQNHQDYYHSILELLFFEVMNKPVNDRKPVTIPQADLIPFLNGGLFEPHKDDYYNGEPLYNLVIPDNWFEQFFGVLEQYNFTIDENSIVDADVSVDPEMLGRIFENLLAEVNPLTGETARKATGSYYTPRTIVDYMVDQSLKQYLITKTKIEEDRVTALLSYESPEVDLTENEKGSMISALDEIKIIDPACGSGAFPMGILHKMILVLQKADPDLKLWLKNHLGNIEPGIFKDRLLERIRNENWEYVRKLLIIQKSIYGVDIQPIGVEISKLRFFLSLIVDEQIDDAKENRGIEALPNLEFKFVAANSLIGLPSVINRQVGMGVGEEIDRLKELRNRYLRSYGKEKKEIEEDFMQTRGKLIEQSINWGGKDALALQLANWNPFSSEACDWFDPEWMFGIDDGFDIVIANPPYLGEKGHKEIFQQIKQGTLKEYYQGKMDLFYFFFHLAINMGTSDSQVTFISTNYYPTATGAKILRQDFKKRTIIRKLINFNELRIFESAQGQHDMLTILSKGCADNTNAETCITSRKGTATPQTLQKILDWQDNQTSYYQVPQNDLYDGEECYIYLYTPSVLIKLRKQGEALGNLCNVNQGIVTGADKISQKHIDKYGIKANVGDGIFVLSEQEIVELNLSAKDREILKPWFKNSDIDKYFSQIKNGYSLVLTNFIKDLSEYPIFKGYLTRFEPILRNRSQMEHCLDWWDLHQIRMKDKSKTGYIKKMIFDGPKIVAPQRSRRNTFGYNEIPWYASADVYFITEKDKSVSLKYILALLNSNLYYLWLYHRGKRKGEALELYQVPLSEIPIKKISESQQQPLIVIVDQILAITKDEDYLTNPAKQAKVKEYERQIDQMVYDLYGLTPEESEIVEGSGK